MCEDLAVLIAYAAVLRTKGLVKSRKSGGTDAALDGCLYEDKTRFLDFDSTGCLRSGLAYEGIGELKEKQQYWYGFGWSFVRR